MHDVARGIVRKGIATLVASGGPDVQQQLAYDIAHSAAAVETASSLIDYGAKGETEGLITCAFVADMVHEVASRILGRESLWGVDAQPFAATMDFVATYRDPDFVASLSATAGPRHLDDEFEMVQDTFRGFATKVIAPRAEHVHRYKIGRAHV